MKKLLIITSLIFLSSILHAQETGLKVKVKSEEKPDIYLDGKKIDDHIMSLLDQSKIKSVNVVKGEEALKKYNAPNGVVLISTKDIDEITISPEKEKVELKVRGNGKDPLFIVDGIKVKKGEIKKIAPDDIDKIDILKGEAAIKQYNSPDGVILITTKKKKN
jgi:hypothetical protein